jgi:hypothetical protein
LCPALSLGASYPVSDSFQAAPRRELQAQNAHCRSEAALQSRKCVSSINKGLLEKPCGEKACPLRVTEIY